MEQNCSRFESPVHDHLHIVLFSSFSFAIIISFLVKKNDIEPLSIASLLLSFHKPVSPRLAFLVSLLLTVSSFTKNPNFVKLCHLLFSRRSFVESRTFVNFGGIETVVCK